MIKENQLIFIQKLYETSGIAPINIYKNVFELCGLLDCNSCSLQTECIDFDIIRPYRVSKEQLEYLQQECPEYFI